jgi:hypothetical protein
MWESAGATTVATVAADTGSGDGDLLLLELCRDNGEMLLQVGTTEAAVAGGSCRRGASTGVGVGGREEPLLAGGGEGKGHHGAPWSRAKLGAARRELHGARMGASVDPSS